MAMDMAALELAVQEHLAAHAAGYGLQPGQIQVHYVLNWGGFVNASLGVTEPLYREALALYREHYG
jgi:hypothetical protein